MAITNTTKQRTMRFFKLIFPALLLPLSIWAQATPVQQVLISITPCRVVDTRNNIVQYGGGQLASGETRTLTVASNPLCGIPGNATAYVLNVTAVAAGPLSYLSIWPAGQKMPLVSLLNDASGQVIANGTIVKAGVNGAISVYATNATDVVLDVMGYFVSVASPPANFEECSPGIGVVNAVNATFTLSRAPTGPSTFYLNGLYQPRDTYRIVGKVITWTAPVAILSSGSLVCVVYPHL